MDNLPTTRRCIRKGMKQPLSYVSCIVAALLAVLNGLVIAGNDLLFGIRSSLPIVSCIIAAIFIVSGLFVWRVGAQLREVGHETPAGSPAYRALSRLMTLAFVVTALMMLGVLYGVCDRIAHGASVFG